VTTMAIEMRAIPLAVTTVSTRIPVLESGNLPFEEDWAVLEALGVSQATLDNDLQDDHLAAVRFAAGMFD